MSRSVIPCPECYTMVGDCSPVSQFIILPLAGVCPNCAVELRRGHSDSRKNWVKTALNAEEEGEEPSNECSVPGATFKEVSSS